MNLLVFLMLLGSSQVPLEQGCRRVCMPDDQRDAAGCCVGAGAPGQPRPESPPKAETTTGDAAAGCAAGQSRSPGTEGHCCWPDQVWAEGRCRGVPTACPDGHAVDENGEGCTLASCAAGQQRMADGVHCCWEGQVFAGGTCRGRPTSCPPHFDPVGESCSDEAWRRQREEQEAAAITQAEEQARRSAELIGQHERIDLTRYGAGYLMGLMRLRDTRSTDPALPMSEGIGMGFDAGFHRTFPLYWEAGVPAVGLDLGVTAGIVFLMSLGESGTNVLSLTGGAEAGLRLWYFIPSVKVQVERILAARPTSLLAYGPGLSIASPETEEGELRWRLNARWFPGLSALTDDVDDVRGHFELSAQLLSLVELELFFRYFEKLGPIEDGASFGMRFGIGL